MHQNDENSWAVFPTFQQNFAYKIERFILSLNSSKIICNDCVFEEFDLESNLHAIIARFPLQWKKI